MKGSKMSDNSSAGMGTPRFLMEIVTFSRSSSNETFMSESGSANRMALLIKRVTTCFIREKSKADKTIKWLEGQPSLANRIIYQNLHPFRTEILLYMMAKTNKSNTRKLFSLYFTQLRAINPTTTGKEQKKMDA